MTQFVAVPMVDMVNADDEVVALASRAEAHHNRLLHRFVQVFVINGDGMVLVQQRARTKMLGPLLLDASVGGHVDAGEDYETAVRREASEELGLDPLGQYVLLGRIHDISDVENMTGMLYLYYSEGPFTGWQAEAERLEWMSTGELRLLSTRFAWMFTGGMLSSIRLYLGRLDGQAPIGLDMDGEPQA